MNFYLVAAAAVFAAGAATGAYYGPILREWYDGAEKTAERLSARIKIAKKKIKAARAAIEAQEGPAE